MKRKRVPETLFPGIHGWDECWGVPLILLLLSGALGMPERLLVGGISAAMLLICGVYALWWNPQRITLGAKEIAVRRGFAVRRIPYEDVLGAKLTRTGPMHTHCTLRIRARGGDLRVALPGAVWEGRDGARLKCAFSRKLRDGMRPLAHAFLDALAARMSENGVPARREGTSMKREKATGFNGRS
ncbi:MAG: hypothetical protein ACI4MF_01325 [Candidatus Faecivicinus sp.]